MFSCTIWKNLIKKYKWIYCKRYHETKLQERLFDILLQFAEKHHLPVLEIPTNMYFWGIIKYVLLQLYDIETAKLIYFKTTYDSLSKILLNKQDSKTVTTNLLFQIDTILGNPVALYNGESICYASTAPGMSEFKKKKIVWHIHPILLQDMSICVKKGIC